MTPVYLSCCVCFHDELVVDFDLQTPKPYDRMKIFTLLLGLCAAASVIAVEDNQNVEKRQLSSILSELEHDIESAVDCAGCDVRITCPGLPNVFPFSVSRNLELRNQMVECA
jgi:hypothetical protein